MSYTLGQAAKTTGKAKSTISKAIKSGKLSAHKESGGSYRIDAAELHRVFPIAQKTVSGEHQETQTSDTVNSDTRIAVLQAELKAAERRADELEADRDRWIEQSQKWEQQALAIADQRPKGLIERLLNK